jgi:hypothetical protein
MKIITGTVVIVAAGAYLKWALRPVSVAFDIGRETERIIRRLRSGEVPVPSQNP